MDENSLAADLDRQFGIPGIASISNGNGAMPRVQITSPLCEGEIYLHGAQVTSWKPAGAEEVLFLSSKSRWEEGQAIRGGIPICFPWFRAKVDDRQAPAHGLVRTKAWQLESITQDSNGIVVTMVTGNDEQTKRWWPGEFRLTHRVTFGSYLKLELICANAGTSPLRFEEALHTYNRVANIKNARVHGLDNVHFLDNTNSNREETQPGDLAIVKTTDNAYLNTQSSVDLVDPDMHRRIRLQKEDSFTTVVWNPWQEGASGMRDLGDGEWTKFLCVEASNILAFPVDLEPDREHKMTAVLSVERF